jgi:hypothetical protein
MTVEWLPDVSVADDADFSRRAFLATWQAIRPLFGAHADYKPIEGRNASHALLDLVGGIDGYIVEGHVVRTVAQRTQRIHIYPRANTFTIRYARSNGTATEFLKRLDAIETDAAVPSLTIQVYYDETHDTPVKVGIAHTVPLYRWVTTHRNLCHHNAARHGGNDFLVVPWWTLAIESDVPHATWSCASHSRQPTSFFNRPTWPSDRWI